MQYPDSLSASSRLAICDYPDSDWKPIRVSQKGAAALFMGVSPLISGIWLNQVLEPASPNTDNTDAPPSQLPRLANRGSRLIESWTPAETATAVAKLVNVQRNPDYNGLGVSPPPGTSISMLRGTMGSIDARGLLIESGGKAILLTLNLPPLDGDKVYQVWLVKSGNVVDAGLLTVDASGYSQTVIIPYSALAEYDGIGITIEPARGSHDPTGVSVLQGDL